MPPPIVDEVATLVEKKNLPAFRPLSSLEHIHVIGHGKGCAACPCCNRQFSEGRQTLNEPTTDFRRSHRSLMDGLDEEEESEEESTGEENDCHPGVLLSGVEYKPRKVLAEGWVHKKGTGNDFFGSRAWKPRYCRLVLGKVEGFLVDVPLLMIYWFSTSETPSTVITLDSTVVMAIDRPDKSAWNTYCFNIIYAKDEQETTRTFTAPKEGRDEWVFAMNKALLNYEKEKSRFKSSENLSKREPPKLYTSPPPAMNLWSGDQFVELSVSPRTPLSPPTSPRSSERRPLPRPDVLVGESFLR